MSIEVSDSVEIAEGKTIFFDVDKNFEVIKHKIESVANTVYCPNAPKEPTRKHNSRLWLESNGLKRKQKRRIEPVSTFITFMLYLIFLFCLFGKMSLSSYGPFTLSNEIWNSIFFWSGNYLVSGTLFFMYLIFLPVSIGLIFGKIFPIETYRYKRMEITQKQRKTILSFTLEDNDDYEFYRALIKKFKAG